ncbi:hypothetical protein HK096_000426 [Nowakowskiella sp. JEL0078]|nr:hypothetical protein HK096_000426 [Nowakowskiella sp. JEL0078]
MAEILNSIRSSLDKIVEIPEENLNAFLLSFLASLGTLLGGIIVVLLTKILGLNVNSRSTATLMGVLQAAAAGVMLYMTFGDLIPESGEVIGNSLTMKYFFVGIVTFAASMAGLHLIGAGDDGEDEIIVEEKETKKVDVMPGKKELWRMGWVTFLALAAHNMPEGLCVYLSALSNKMLGFQLTVAILLHNIPEGMAVAIPLWAATDGSTFHVLLWTFVNGLAEPVGVLIGATIFAGRLTQNDMAKSLAAVAGVMACISLHELQPMAIRLAGRTTASISLFVGMFICFVALETVEEYFGGH